MDPDAAAILRPLFAAWLGVLGAAVGSFLNVVIARLPHGRSVVRPRSACPRCGAGIAWYDNLPILSWLLLRARCRACRAPISARYPLVEALVAGLAVLAALRHGPSGAALAELAFAALLVALAFIDLDTWYLPFELSLPLIALGLAAGWLGLTPAGGLLGALLGAAAGFALFAAIHFLGGWIAKKEALAFGDVVLLTGLCAWFGPRGLLPVVLLSSVQGAVVGMALLLMGKERLGPAAPGATSTPTSTPTPTSTSTPTPTSTSTPTPAEAEDDWVPDPHHIPYGPFLALAALEWLYLAGPIVRAVPVLDVFVGR